KTSTDKQISEYYRQREALEQLLSANLISVDEYNKRIEESIGDTLGLQEFDVTLKRVSEKVQEATTEMSEFQKQAARNMQTHFADFLFDPFNDGLKGMLKGFADTLRRMLAEAAAAKIFKYIGSLGSGSGSGFLKAIGSIFGGARAT